ncbi:hypothetical protein [Solidesulfovibrio sp.]
MRIRNMWIGMIALGSLLACSLWMPAPATAAGETFQVAQFPGGQQGGQQGGQRPPQGQQGGQQGGKQGGMPPQQQGGQGANNSCVQSYQRCVMMCAGVAACVNNCNIGYAVCQQQGGGS